MTVIFDKKYDGESIVDLGRDFSEMFEFNPAADAIPVDEYGIHKGTFKVTVVWTPEE